MATHVVAVNDSAEILQLYREILEGEGGYRVTIMSYKPLLLEDVKASQPDLVITDYKFREEDVGYNFVQQLKMDRDTASIPVIVVSAAVRELRDVEGYLASKNIGVLFKPFDVDDLLALVSQKLSGESSGNEGDPGAALTAEQDESAENRIKREMKTDGD